MIAFPEQLRQNDFRFRLLGFLPLVFFFAQAIHYTRLGELGTMLWMCNIGNLVLALGLFLKRPLLIRIAVLWMVPGLLVWIFYVLLPWGIFLSSVLAHVGGLVVGIVALRRVRMDRWSWIYALVWYFAMQLLSRLFTSAALNVNVAHAVDPKWQHLFDSYWKFWTILAVVAVIQLGLLNLLFYKLWPED
ncbi:MAG TPA: hypothetical protein VJS64_04680 [Pyrinomonadaceae bacterium]|nr:hypothetical protein [Pyrinomonadaceae bacterium]